MTKFDHVVASFLSLPPNPKIQALPKNGTLDYTTYFVTSIVIMIIARGLDFFFFFFFFSSFFFLSSERSLLLAFSLKPLGVYNLRYFT